MRAITGVFLKGLAAVLPVAITLYLLYWLGTSAESILGRGIQLVVPTHLYWPGMGLVAGLALVFLVGLLMNAWLVRGLFRLGDRLLARIPLVKTIYGAVSDLMSFFSHSQRSGFSRVVTVELSGARVLGLVTREDFADLPPALAHGEDVIAVYLPMSYQVGGYTVLVPRAAVEAVDMPLEEAMRFAVTGGMSAKRAAVNTGAPRP